MILAGTTGEIGRVTAGMMAAATVYVVAARKNPAVKEMLPYILLGALIMGISPFFVQ